MILVNRSFSVLSFAYDFVNVWFSDFKLQLFPSACSARFYKAKNCSFKITWSSKGFGVRGNNIYLVSSMSSSISWIMSFSPQDWSESLAHEFRLSSSTLWLVLKWNCYVADPLNACSCLCSNICSLACCLEFGWRGAALQKSFVMFSSSMWFGELL